MAGLRKKSEKELQETFEMFLFRLGERMERLKDAAAEGGISLDYSLESLKQIESFVLQKGIDREHDLYDDVACYIGEVVRKNFGGRWECCLDMKENSLLYGMPVISGYNQHTPTQSIGVCCSHKVSQSGFIPFITTQSVGVLNPPHE